MVAENNDILVLLRRIDKRLARLEKAREKPSIGFRGDAGGVGGDMVRSTYYDPELEDSKRR